MTEMPLAYEKMTRIPFVEFAMPLGLKLMTDMPLCTENYKLLGETHCSVGQNKSDEYTGSRRGTMPTIAETCEAQSAH